MPLDQLSQFVTVFVLVVFRVAAMMLYAPLFGSARIPKRVRVLLAIIIAIGMVSSVKVPDQLPDTTWGLALGIGGEIMFGLAMGMTVSIVFIAVQWAGEMVGQQLGFNLSEVFDPQFSQGGAIIGDMYFMLSLVIFLGINGHHLLLAAVRDSFSTAPVLTVGVDFDVLDFLIDMLSACTTLAIQIAAPVLVTMLVMDLVLGLIGKTIPQINIMTTGLSARAAVGILVVLLGVVMTSTVIRGAIERSLLDVRDAYSVVTN